MPDFGKVVRCLAIALLKPRIAQSQQQFTPFVVDVDLTFLGQNDPLGLGSCRLFDQGDVGQTIAVFLTDKNFASGKFIDHLVGHKQGLRIAPGNRRDRIAHRIKRLRGDRGIDPKGECTEQYGYTQNRQTDAQQTGSAGPQSHRFIVRRHPPEDEQDRGKEGPRHREGERKRQHIEHEHEEIFHRNIPVDHQVEQFLENVAENKDQAEHEEAVDRGDHHATPYVTVD